jgi:predicted neuraminidase
MSIKFAYPVSVIFTRDRNFRYAREPLLRRMPDGSLYTVIYTGGTREPDPRNIVAACRSTDNGAHWSYPETLLSHPFRACWAAELFTDGPCPTIFFNTLNFDTHYAELKAFMTSTMDSGHSWSEPIGLRGLPANFSVRQGRVLSDGSWIFPVYWQEQRQNWQAQLMLANNTLNNTCGGWIFTSGAIRSTNKGQTFSLHTVDGVDNYNLWEPDLTELEPGHLMMFFRVECPEHRLWQAESFDGGRSWGKSSISEIPNVGTKFQIHDVHNKKVLLNNVCGPGNDDRRYWLEAWVSSDGLKTFERKIRIAELIEDEEFRNSSDPVYQVAYPHAFYDAKEDALLLAIDTIQKLYFMRIPAKDLV